MPKTPDKIQETQTVLCLKEIPKQISFLFPWCPFTFNIYFSGITNHNIILL